MTLPFDEAALVKEYTPMLVLYPEIEGRSERKRNENYPHESPLLWDYHPRDIRVVLEHSSLHVRFRLGQAKLRTWGEMLDRMEKTQYRLDLDLLPGVKQEDKASFWKEYGEVQDRDAKYLRTCYSRTTTGWGIIGDRVLVQYWYPYFYNDFWNTHEMDWEVVMIVFKVTGERPVPTICAYSAHLGGHWLPWSKVEKTKADLQKSDDGTHPVAYVANGSHANYFYGPGMYVTAPPLVDMAAKLLKKHRRLVDYTTSWGHGARHLVAARFIPPNAKGRWTGEWRWLNHEGRWGSPGDFLDLEFGDSGPLGPPQSGDRWDSPFRWINSSCTRAPAPEKSRVASMVEPGEA